MMLFLGDWAPQQTVVSLELDDDYIFLNLEGPIMDILDLSRFEREQTVSIKAGPKISHNNLPKINGKLIGCLANNHSMDFGVFGIEKTISALSVNEGLSVGYGNCIETAQEPLRIECQGAKVSIIALAENQFGMATLHKPGFAGLGSWVYEAICKEKVKCDFLVISVHAGIEDYPHPAPFFQDLYRSYIDVGADAVIAHHPHVAQGVEWYKGSVIAYSLGNLAVKPESWSHDPLALNSLGLKIDFDQNPPKIEILLIEEVCENEMVTVRQMRGVKAKKFQEVIDLLSEPLYNRSELEYIWSVVAEECWENYVSLFMFGPNIPTKTMQTIRNQVKKVLSLLRITNRPISSMSRLLHYHAIRCESHREIAQRALDENNPIDPEARKFVEAMRNRIKQIINS